MQHRSWTPTPLPPRVSSCLIHRFLKELTHGNYLYADHYEISVDASHFLGESYTGYVPSGLWKSGAHGACQLVQDICFSQRPYLEAEKRLPALPDCVFAFKRFKRIKVRKDNKPKRQKVRFDTERTHKLCRPCYRGTTDNPADNSTGSSDQSHNKTLLRSISQTRQGVTQAIPLHPSSLRQGASRLSCCFYMSDPSS
jgi:hypothetical protein